MNDAQRKAMFAKKYSLTYDRVLEKEGLKRIVGYKGGDTFDEKSIQKIHPQIQNYITYHEEEPEQEQKIHAVNHEVARHIADAHWIDKNYRLLHHKQTFTEVSDKFKTK